MNFLRSFLKKNLPWKIGALLLAIVIWNMINNIISSPGGNPSLPEERKILQNVPVLVLGRAGAQGDVIVRPPTVNVTVKGSPEEVRRVQASEITLYVDISGLAGKERYRQRVLRIPTRHQVRSLNLASAVAVAVYEARRQIVSHGGLGK